MGGNKIYIKFSNGSTTHLIDMNDSVAQNEAISNGFLMLMDSDGLPQTVDSTQLMTYTDLSKAQMLRAIAEKHRIRNEAMAAKNNLSSRYGI